MSGPLPRVIVNADDFGLHPAINEGIESAHRDGIVTSASVMTLGPACDDAVRRACALPDLDLGLHFTLVGVPGLPSGLRAFFVDFLRGRLPARVLADALRRQLDQAVRDHRLLITHIDSHQHLHAFPAVMRVVCGVAAEYDIPGVRLPLDGPPCASVGPGRRAQAATLRAMARLSRRYIAAHGRRTTDHFRGMAVSGHLSAETLAAYLRHARAGTTEIVCHPGADNAALAAEYPWGYDWKGERDALRRHKGHEAAIHGTARLSTWSSLDAPT